VASTLLPGSLDTRSPPSMRRWTGGVSMSWSVNSTGGRGGILDGGIAAACAAMLYTFLGDMLRPCPL
jgi:hypothetical protein